jgi:hypothetical protein
MAKVDFDYLRKKYKTDEKLQQMLQDKEYRGIMERVFDVNIHEIQQQVGERSRIKWQQILEKPSLPPVKYEVPSLRSVIPTREQVYQVAFQKSKTVTENMRGALTVKLRNTIREFEAKKRVKTYVKQRIHPDLEENMEEKLRDFFRNYTHKDPRVGMPSNVHAIAVTELRGAINNAKRAVADQIKSMNPQLAMKKRWIHNPQLSMEPENIRIGHARMNGKTILFEKQFLVPIYRWVGSKAIKVGETYMDGPHDPNAPAEQNCSCHCDCEYFV